MSGLKIIAPPPFAYERPATISEALDLLARGDALPLAGGTDLVPMRASGAVAPATLVDVKGIDELRQVTTDENGTVRIGAAVTLRELEQLAIPGMDAVTDGARVVGAAQTRTRGTLVGNLCRASPAGDTLCGLLVLDAEVHLCSVAGERVVPVRDFFAGPGRTARDPTELVVAVTVSARGTASAYQRFTYRRSMDLAVVGVAVALQLDRGCCRDASAAIGAAAPTPRIVPAAGEALVGRTIDDGAIADCVAALVAAASPIDDIRGTRRHRLRVIGVIADEVVRAALKRATAR